MGWFDEQLKRDAIENVGAEVANEIAVQGEMNRKMLSENNNQNPEKLEEKSYHVNIKADTEFLKKCVTDGIYNSDVEQKARHGLSVNKGHYDTTVNILSGTSNVVEKVDTKTQNANISFDFSRQSVIDEDITPFKALLKNTFGERKVSIIKQCMESAGFIPAIGVAVPMDSNGAPLNTPPQEKPKTEKSK